MPLSKGQIEALKTIAAARDPESYVAGSTPLNRSEARYSSDIDIFHDREARVAEAAERDARSLEGAGFVVRWLRRSGGVHTLSAEKGGESVRLDYVADSDFRFFPAVPDPTFGFMLHPVDIAVNKSLAAANRRELRDIVDLVALDRRILPLGAVIWAAVDKAPGFTPEGMIAEIRRNSIYAPDDWRALLVSASMDAGATMRDLRAALDAAEAFVTRMPTNLAGRLFLKGPDIVQPDLDRLDDYETHVATRRGHWPSSPEIAAAMIARFQTPPPQRR